MNLFKNVKKSWKKILKKYINDDDIEKLYKNKTIFPKINNIFEAFKYFDLNETKLVFIGQDPYINYKIINNEIIPQATGLSFSVPEEFPIPPSLKNIFIEIKNSYPDFIIPENGNLIKWVVEEKILLLNTSLTVEKNKSNSHQTFWRNITDNIIKDISDNHPNTIFLLLGNNAKSKKKYINQKKHIIIEGVHPSPLSSYKGFFNSNIFKKINIALNKQNKKKINW
jgi:uracil-DNA glycosylase